MASYDNLEKSSLQINQNRNKKSSYGSLRKDNTNFTIVNIKHKLIKGESIQGISLKYGVSIESIKKVNKLWSNDLALIKEYLLIPIPKDRVNEFSNQLNDDIDFVNNSHKNTNNIIQNNENHNDHYSDSEEHDRLIIKKSSHFVENESYKDFLNKFDSLLNQSKEKLKNLETIKSLTTQENEKSSLNDNDNLFKVKTKNEREEYFYEHQQQQQQKNDNFTDILKTPDFIIKQTINGTNGTYQVFNTTRAKQAYETLQKLEKEKDDLYEL